MVIILIRNQSALNVISIAFHVLYQHAQNYKLSDSQCVLSFESESNKKEFVSLKGCLVYDKNNDCTKCSPGYQLKNGICDGTIITIVTMNKRNINLAVDAVSVRMI